MVALPHSGNWDLAGAYAQLTGMPVTTVAEALPGPDFAAFVAFRERLGMQVLSHRDPAVIGELLGGRPRRPAGLPARRPRPGRLRRAGDAGPVSRSPCRPARPWSPAGPGRR